MRGFVKRTFGFWQRLGLHVLPVHFYSPVPDTSALTEDMWRRRSALAGIDMREPEQLALARDFAARYRSEYQTFPRTGDGTPGRYFLENGSFLAVDAEMLHCMIRHYRPRRMIEIGAGFSTFLAAEAHRRNVAEGAPPCDFTAIEPYPGEALRSGVPGLSRLDVRPVQEVPVAAFEALGENDILFIDSSHVLRIGGDVAYEYLEILPRLRPGVVVHVHDIFLPYDYPKNWVTRQLRFWNEQYLLQAFLAFNQRFEVLWAGAWMHHSHPNVLAECFPSYGGPRPGGDFDDRRHWPVSFWMRRTS